MEKNRYMQIHIVIHLFDILTMNLKTQMYQQNVNLLVKNKSGITQLLLKSVN